LLLGSRLSLPKPWTFGVGREPDLSPLRYMNAWRRQELTRKHVIRDRLNAVAEQCRVSKPQKPGIYSYF